MYALLAEGEDIRRFGKGSTHTTIYFPEVKAFYLCLAPKPEQKRIVAKIGALRARSIRARHELDLVPRLIERYKQAILAKASTGELTKDWREANPDGGREADVARAMITQSRSVTVLADASKFGRGGLIKVAPLEAVHRVVTDPEPPQAIANALEDAGVSVIKAV